VISCFRGYRKNVTGNNASGSPRLNIANGPRMIRSASISPDDRFALSHAVTAADCTDSPYPLN